MNNRANELWIESTPPTPITSRMIPITVIARAIGINRSVLELHWNSAEVDDGEGVRGSGEARSAHYRDTISGGSLNPAGKIYFRRFSTILDVLVRCYDRSLGLCSSSVWM